VIVNLVAANKVHWISCFGPLIQALEPLIMQVIGVALDASDFGGALTPVSGT
jgi:hypothetical protein